ncbi:RHS repeat domain-containing protein [Pseudoalteromonas luteoviolacea]|uniref:RHS repeat domain-containing protein n=1 Tax=Pseudoalteromonas luteoviolacea TaxID=43657 RepID=UPI00069250C0|nr:RHS repeat-associated core domain-containing protein [Pseudoalteromonas luteoviolacea]
MGDGRNGPGCDYLTCSNSTVDKLRLTRVLKFTTTCHDDGALYYQFCVNQSHCADYDYDLDGLVTRIGNLSLVRAADRMGIITGTSIENITHEISYNQYGELTGDDFEFNQQALYRSEYAHDDNGRIVRKTEYLTGNIELQDYVYDDLGRLSEVDDGEKVAKYQYDSNGNRLVEEITQGTSTVRVAATYDAQDRLLTYGNCTFSYTTNGHLASKVCAQQEQRFSYDIFGNLLGVEVYNDGAISKQIAYHVDPQNRRVAKWVDGQKAVSYLYAGQLNPVAELDSDGKLSALFIYGSKGHVPDYMVKGGRQYRFITDQLGSPRLIVDAASGEIAQQLSYDTFGQVTQDTNPGFQPFGFTGGLYDADTQLVRFGARDYDAHTARWTAKDPIGFGGGDTNLYAYVSSDPVNFIDPTGHFLANLISGFRAAGKEMLWQLGHRRQIV